MAVKIIDVDDLDYKLDLDQKDEAIEDFRKEVKTLKLLRDSQAKNINYIQEAFDLHSQLWIVSDYCPGGSVHTLMKATPGPGLEEDYIIPIARELAVALKYVHDAGVIHRDVKCMCCRPSCLCGMLTSFRRQRPHFRGWPGPTLRFRRGSYHRNRGFETIHYHRNAVLDASRDALYGYGGPTRLWH